jgi:Zn-finger nucleic acid-binding protein
MKENEINQSVFKCLNCEDVDMKKVTCGPDLTVEQCESCGGLWLDAGELINILELGDFYINHLDTSLKRPVEKNRIRECPRCEVVLQPKHPKNLPDILIDICPDCKGIWLDRGELVKLSKISK